MEWAIDGIVLTITITTILHITSAWGGGGQGRGGGKREEEEFGQ